MSSTKQAVSRSVYVAKLRRAFLLRAHPDKFRDANIREGQSLLVKALSQRMSAQDFQDYTANVVPTSSTARFFSEQQKSSKKIIPYVLEKRNGMYLHQTLNINDSVENILKSLATAIEKSGAVPPALPSDELLKAFPNGGKSSSSGGRGGFTWFSNTTSSSGGIDHRFDVNTTKGRDLLAFLNSVDGNEIERRRSCRMDAIALASIARQKYSFQAVDGILLGWSSESFAVLLSSLVKLHEEHSSRFHVESFYPLRLVFSPDEFRMPLDVYGGNIYLNPASTQLQWLEALQNVTPQSLEELEAHRILLQERTSLLQNSLGIKIKKGHSCTSQSYHFFLEELSKSLSEDAVSSSAGEGSKSLQMEWLRLVVESPLACRRPRVTNEGHIRVHNQMSLDEIRKAISRFSPSAQDRFIQEKEHSLLCKQATTQIQFALGLQRVFRSGVVSHSEFLSTLSRLMEHTSDLKRWFSGYSLGIGSSGQFCRLGDDGSILVPHDWR